MSELLYHIRWDGEKKPTSLVSKDGEIGRECGIVGCPRRGFEDGLECHTRLFHKLAKKSFATFQTAEAAGMPDEEASCLPMLIEADVCCLLGCCAHGVKVRTGKKSEGVQVFGRRLRAVRMHG